MDQQAKDAFQAWNTTVKSYTETVDTNWEQLWKGTMNAMAAQSIDRYAAYNKIDQLEKHLESARNKFIKLSSPSELSRNQKDILDKANSNYIAWIYCRREACQKLKEMLDVGVFPPAKVKEINDSIAQGDVFVLKAAASVLTVEKELGLLKPAK